MHKHRYILIRCCLLLTLLIVLHVGCLDADNYVVIHQVLYDSPLNEVITNVPYSHGEFIELYNAGADSVSLAGWSLRGNGETEIYAFPLGITMASQTYLVIAYRSSSAPAFHLSDVYALPLDSTKYQILYQNNIILSNSGESLVLCNAFGEMVDSMYYDGTSHLTNNRRIYAANADNTVGDSCLSLHRRWVEFDERGHTVPAADEWLTDKVSFTSCSLQAPVFFEKSLMGDTPLSSSANYVVSLTPLDAVSRVDNNGGRLSMSNGIRTQTTIQYYDGLGRSTQQVGLHHSPQGQDMVSLTEYSGLSNVVKRWLPIVQDGDGQYVEPSILTYMAQSTYQDNRPFVETLFEPSFLSRTIGTKKAGDTYVSHPTSQTYTLNSEEDNVVLYEVISGGLLGGTQGEQLQKTNSIYAPYTLYKNTVADEDGVAATTFSDKQGKKILERRNGNDTYYVYDDKNQLRYVVPPMSVNALSAGTYDIEQNTTIKNLVYCYQYDERGNTIYKRLPGCEPHYMVYDKAGQLVLRQDGNQRLHNLWTMYAYDSIGRNLYTSEIPTNKTHQQLIALYADQWQVEHYSSKSQPNNLATTGYASTIMGNSHVRMLTINYYDDYAFLNRLSTPDRQALRYNNQPEYGIQHENAVGLLTGIRIYNLSDNTYTTTVYYYDYRGRVVQQRSTRPNGGYCHTYTRYNFDGSIAAQLTEQGTATDMTRERYTHTYDHNGRLLTTSYKLNDEASILLSEYRYDSIGHLTQCVRHNRADTIRYTYDLRNHPTAISSSVFSEQLYYADDLVQGVTPRYNGNLSATTIQQADTILPIAYTYDQQNQLTASYSTTPNGSQQIETFSYDERGNVVTLRRYKDLQMTDDLYYTYLPNSNQVSSITDSAEPSDLYDVKEYHDNGVGETDMLYDANGNLIYDADRGIAAIRYNRLNLPDTIQFANGNQIVNLYDANGYKYKSIYYTVLTTAIVPDYAVAHYGFDSDTVHYRIVEYSGNIETTYTQQDTIRRIFNAEGYTQLSTCNQSYNDSIGQSISHQYYYYKDHLGNICAVKDMTLDTILQHTFYYPSGMPMAMSVGQSAQPYKYNGKEYVEMYGLDEYDISARHYYAAIVRTTTLDPLAEQYYYLSPYSWCGNNCIANIDETGAYYFDWDEKVYRSSYGEHEVVSWNEVFDNHFHETPPTKYATAGTLLYEFFTGNGERKRDFNEEDGFAQKFTHSSAIQEIYSDVAKQIFIEGKKQGEANFKLRNKERQSIFRRDLKTIFSLGRIGNINETIIGSFETNWELQYFDSNGNAIVKITAFNEMSAKSLFRNPKYGYTYLWKKYISQPIDRMFENGIFGTGVMKTTSQTISWTIIIKRPEL